ncbi:MAG: hypothetical protein ACI9TY_001473 [Alphaproteobacteria bacterium]|jgi:hypothetical protein
MTFAAILTPEEYVAGCSLKAIEKRAISQNVIVVELVNKALETMAHYRSNNYSTNFRQDFVARIECEYHCFVTVKTFKRLFTEKGWSVVYVEGESGWGNTPEANIPATLTISHDVIPHKNCGSKK